MNPVRPGLFYIIPFNARKDGHIFMRVGQIKGGLTG